jgi:type II secretory pathway pseudopilin PulG
MRHESTLNQGKQRLSTSFLRRHGLAAAAAVIFLVSSAGAIQGNAKQEQPPKPAGDTSAADGSQKANPLLQEISKYPGLLEELGHLQIKLAQTVKMPPARGHSKLLQLLPASTDLYVAAPNYGGVVHQVLQVVRQERRESAVLNDWWEHGPFAAQGPLAEDALDKFYQFSQYLGDEIVISAGSQDADKSLLIVAEIAKPGLKAYLQRMLGEIGGASAPVRIFDVQTLAAAKASPSKSQALALVRPDFLVVAFDLATLRRFNTQIDQRGGRLATTPFGNRLAQVYVSGAEILAAADLQKIVSAIPQKSRQDRQMFQRSGFADLKYFIWEHKDVPGQASSRVELSFNGPRHGVASWLAAPAPLGSLDFVSPKAVMAVVFRLKNLAEVYDDVREIADSMGSGGFAFVAQAEEQLNISFKEALFRKFGGEIALEMTSLGGQQEPVWKVILQTSDPQGLLQTLTVFHNAAHLPAKSDVVDGVTYYSLEVPSGSKPMEINYAFVDGYILVAPSRSALTDAVKLHRGGDSLAKSRELRDAMPAGHSPEASGLFYQNVGAWMTTMASQFPPELAQIFPQVMGASKPNVVAFYGEENALREASNNGAADLAIVGVVAAVAIPNLLRSRMAANEAAAMSTVRTINTAQVTYLTSYPDKGYAPDLASMGPDPAGKCDVASISDAHACLLDGTLANGSCTSGVWCTKSGYRYSVTVTCKGKLCDGYVAVATPVETSTGTKSFCSTEDGVVRSQSGSPLASPVSAEECQDWAPLQ